MELLYNIMSLHELFHNFLDLSKIPKKIQEVSVLNVSLITNKSRRFSRNIIFLSSSSCQKAGNVPPPFHLLLLCLLEGIRP